MSRDEEGKDESATLVGLLKKDFPELGVVEDRVDSRQLRGDVAIVAPVIIVDTSADQPEVVDYTGLTEGMTRRPDEDISTRDMSQNYQSALISASRSRPTKRLDKAEGLDLEPYALLSEYMTYLETSLPGTLEASILDAIRPKQVFKKRLENLYTEAAEELRAQFVHMPASAQGLVDDIIGDQEGSEGPLDDETRQFMIEEITRQLHQIGFYGFLDRDIRFVGEGGTAMIFMSKLGNRNIAIRLDYTDLFGVPKPANELLDIHKAIARQFKKADTDYVVPIEHHSIFTFEYSHLDERKTVKMFRQGMTKWAKDVKGIDLDTIVKKHQWSDMCRESSNLPKVVVTAMEFVEGKHMDQYIKEASKGDWHQIDTARLIKRVVSVVGRIHEAGYIHKDLKPENILITEEGDVRVLDLGVAEKIGEITPGSGTPGYISPEHFAAKNLPRMDMYSMGCILYEMLVGETPFHDVQAKYQTQLERETDVSRKNELTKQMLLEIYTEINRGLGQKADRLRTTDYMKDIILTALNPDVDEQYQSADDLIADLEGAIIDMQTDRGYAAQLGATHHYKWQSGQYDAIMDEGPQELSDGTMVMMRGGMMVEVTEEEVAAYFRAFDPANERPSTYRLVGDDIINDDVPSLKLEGPKKK